MRAMKKKEPGSILVYGPTKIGKTLDVCHAFKTEKKAPFVLLSEPDGLSSVEANLGWMPDNHLLCDLRTPFVEATQVITKLAPAIKAGRYSAIIVDTGSELALRILDAYSLYVTDDPRRLYPAVSRQFRTLIRQIIHMGVWCVMTCHTQDPRDGERFRRGGPALPGDLVERSPSMFSLVLRSDYAIDNEGETTRVYRCKELHPQWVMGDRYSVALAVQPMDLRPLLWQALNPGAAKLPKFAPKPIRKRAAG